MRCQYPRLVLFDLGDTLVHIPRNRLEFAAGGIIFARNSNPLVCDKRRLVETSIELEFAIRDEWIIRIGEDINQVRSDKDEAEYWSEFFKRVLGRMGIRFSPKGLLDHLVAMQADPESFVCFPDAHPTLGGLDAAGIEMGIISNAFPSAVKILRHLNLLGYFKYTFLSCDPPPATSGLYAKPAPSIYERAIKCTQVLPDEIIFVDDRPPFVKGACDVGIRGILIDRQDQYRDWRGEKIRGLDEIIRALQIAPLTSHVSPVGNKMCRIPPQLSAAAMPWTRVDACVELA